MKQGAVTSFHFNPFLNKGEILLATSQYHEALDCFEDWLKENPNHIEILQGKAEALCGLSRFPEALKIYETALKIEPNNAKLHYGKAETLVELSRLPAALQSYEQSLKIDKTLNNINAKLGRAKIQFEMKQQLNLTYLNDLLNDVTKYENFLKQIPKVDLNPIHQANIFRWKGELLYCFYKKWTKNSAADFFKQGYSQALDNFANALALNPYDAAAYRGKGEALMELHRYEDSLKSFEIALYLNPENAFSYKSAGDVLFFLSYEHAALDSYTTAIELNPNYSNAFCGKGNVLSRQLGTVLSYEMCDHISYEPERLKEILQYFDIALKLNPQNIYAVKAKAKVLWRSKNYKDALQTLENLLKLNPEDADVYLLKGNFLEEILRRKLDVSLLSNFLYLGTLPNIVDYMVVSLNGDQFTEYHTRIISQALECYEKAIKIDHNKKEAYAGKARILEERNQYAGATQAKKQEENCITNSNQHYFKSFFSVESPLWWQESTQLRVLLRKRDASAEYNLGCKFLNGTDELPKSEKLAIAWFKKAAKGGNKQAKEYLDLEEKNQKARARLQAVRQEASKQNNTTLNKPKTSEITSQQEVKRPLSLQELRQQQSGIEQKTEIPQWKRSLEKRRATLVHHTVTAIKEKIKTKGNFPSTLTLSEDGLPVVTITGINGVYLQNDDLKKESLINGEFFKILYRDIGDTLLEPLEFALQGSTSVLSRFFIDFNLPTSTKQKIPCFFIAATPIENYSQKAEDITKARAFAKKEGFIAYFECPDQNLNQHLKGYYIKYLFENIVETTIELAIYHSGFWEWLEKPYTPSPTAIQASLKPFIPSHNIILRRQPSTKTHRKASLPDAKRKTIQWDDKLQHWVKEQKDFSKLNSMPDQLVQDLKQKEKESAEVQEKQDQNNFLIEEINQLPQDTIVRLQKEQQELNSKLQESEQQYKNLQNEFNQLNQQAVKNQLAIESVHKDLLAEEQKTNELQVLLANKKAKREAAEKFKNNPNQLQFYISLCTYLQNIFLSAKSNLFSEIDLTGTLGNIAIDITILGKLLSLIPAIGNSLDTVIGAVSTGLEKLDKIRQKNILLTIARLSTFGEMLKDVEYTARQLAEEYQAIFLELYTSEEEAQQNKNLFAKGKEFLLKEQILSSVKLVAEVAASQILGALLDGVITTTIQESLSIQFIKAVKTPPSGLESIKQILLSVFKLNFIKTRSGQEWRLDLIFSEIYLKTQQKTPTIEKVIATKSSTKQVVSVLTTKQVSVSVPDHAAETNKKIQELENRLKEEEEKTAKERKQQHHEIQKLQKELQKLREKLENDQDIDKGRQALVQSTTTDGKKSVIHPQQEFVALQQMVAYLCTTVAEHSEVLNVTNPNQDNSNIPAEDDPERLELLEKTNSLR